MVYLTYEQIYLTLQCCHLVSQPVVLFVFKKITEENSSFSCLPTLLIPLALLSFSHLLYFTLKTVLQVKNSC